jgi:hypothetical protein
MAAAVEPWKKAALRAVAALLRSSPGSSATWVSDTKVVYTRSADSGVIVFLLQPGFPFEPAQIVDPDDRCLFRGCLAMQLATMVELFEKEAVLVYCHRRNPRDAEAPHFALDYINESIGKQLAPDVRMDTVDVLPIDAGSGHCHFQCDAFEEDFYSTHSGRYYAVFMLDAGGPWWHAVNDMARSVAIVLDVARLLKPGGRLHVSKMIGRSADQMAVMINKAQSQKGVKLSAVSSTIKSLNNTPVLVVTRES